MNAKEREASPIAAFFDIDGTLVPEPSLEMRFFAGLRKRGAIPVWNYVRWAGETLRLLPRGLVAMRHANKRYLRGIGADKVFQLMETISFYEEGVQRVAWHARLGHKIVLVSGTLEPLAQIAATALECELEAHGVESCVLIRATRLVEEHGCWTGRVAEPAMYGEEKSRAIKRIVKEKGLDVSRCYGYGNSLTDREMLSAVGRAQVVNPGKEMAAMANRCDWPIWHWRQEKTMISPGISRVETKIQGMESRA